MLGPAGHLPDDDQAGVNPQADGQVDPEVPPEPLVQSPNLFDDLQPGAHSPLGIILVGERMAEVDQEPIAQVLRDVPLEAADHLGADLLVGPHDLAQLLGIEPLRERGRAHQVAEHDRQLAALGRGGRGAR